MNQRQLRTLNHIFETPSRADITWTEVESLFRALGAEIEEGRGSRVRISVAGRRAVLHRPHPRKEINKSTVESIRTLLRLAQVTPERFK